MSIWVRLVCSLRESSDLLTPLAECNAVSFAMARKRRIHIHLAIQIANTPLAKIMQKLVPLLVLVIAP